MLEKYRNLKAEERQETLYYSEETRVLKKKILQKLVYIGGSMYRNRNYDEKLAQKFKNPEFAQEYLISLVQDEDEPMTVEEALRFTIPKIGVSEFARNIGESTQNVSDFINAKRNLKKERLDRYLGPFGLKIRLTLEKVA